MLLVSFSSSAARIDVVEGITTGTRWASFFTHNTSPVLPRVHSAVQEYQSQGPVHPRLVPSKIVTLAMGEETRMTSKVLGQIADSHPSLCHVCEQQ